MWHRGQEVECINDSGCRDLVKQNVVYVIEEVQAFTRVWDRGGIMHENVIGLNLVGVSVPRPYWGFNAIMFRPIVKKTTDISAFTDMLKEEELV
jgi:hypothetical protein